MEVINDRVNKKREIFSWYQKALKNVDVEFMPELENSRGNRWLTTLLFKKNTNIHKIIQALEVGNCESRPLWKPMHMQALFNGCKTQLNGVSEDMFTRGLCLPSGTEMTREDVAYICDIIKESI